MSSASPDSHPGPHGLRPLGPGGARTLAERAAGLLRQGIIRGRYEAGQRLRETELAAALGISRIPLREAFHQLAGEGLLEIRPNRGVFVTGSSAAELAEIAELCRMIEPHLIGCATPRLTPAVLDRALPEIEAMDRLSDPAEWFQANWRFHTALYEPAQRPLQLDQVRALWERAGRYVFLLASAPERRRALNQEHRGILEACRAGDRERAVLLLTQHLDGGKQAVTRILVQGDPRSAVSLG